MVGGGNKKGEGGERRECQGGRGECDKLEM